MLLFRLLLRIIAQARLRIGTLKRGCPVYAALGRIVGHSESALPPCRGPVKPDIGRVAQV